MHHLYFGLETDGPLPPLPAGVGTHYLGPRKLLRWLEGMTALGGQPENNDYLRIELYRQALQQYAGNHPNVFYAASFEADRFATATVLLEQRDLLVLAGWDFAPTADAPGRLPVFAAVEQLFLSKTQDPTNAQTLPGEADRWKYLLSALAHQKLPIEKVSLYEPPALHPPHLRQLWAVLEQQGISVQVVSTVPQAQHPNGMLHRLQQYLQGQSIERGLQPDEPKEVICLSARNDTDIAMFLAQTLAQNTNWKPHFLIPNLRQNLELAMVNEGLPAFGILSATLARPALQVLKLAPAFLWYPVDIFKIMEFVTLPVKPLERGLALEIARVLAEKPGMFSDLWYGAVLGYLQQEHVDEKVRKEYRFWFERTRYRTDAPAPKQEVLRLYEHLEEWGLQHHEQSNIKDGSMLTLAAQAGRICELLRALPEQAISALELERIVRTIVEPSPAFFAETAVGHYPFFHQTGAAIAPMDELVWWNCLYEDEVPPPDFWQPSERQWLEARAQAPDPPQVAAKRKLLLRVRPILNTRKRVWICLPDQVGGTAAVHHLLASDMATLFQDTKAISCCLDVPEQRARLAQWLRLPPQDTIEPRNLAQPRPFLQVHWQETEPTRDETPTGLERLFYYPHTWFFQQKLGLYPSNLLSVTRDRTLLGNLSHRFFEMLLANDRFAQMDKTQLWEWVDDQADDLLRKEGATLLLYGREPERKVFLQKVKSAAWNLVSMLRSNDWTVVATEKTLEGQFGPINVRGKADLVLKRGKEQAIVDLKWGGLSRRRDLIKNEEDLQLVLYAHLLPPEGQWPHTAYYILESGKMVARNQAAFREAVIAGKSADDHTEVCARIFEKMQKTYAWRLEQLRRGQVEIRTAATTVLLEDIHAGQLVELLEMRHQDHPWDDYRTLIDFM